MNIRYAGPQHYQCLKHPALLVTSYVSVIEIWDAESVPNFVLSYRLLVRGAIHPFVGRQEGLRVRVCTSRIFDVHGHDLENAWR